VSVRSGHICRVWQDFSMVENSVVTRRIFGYPSALMQPAKLVLEKQPSGRSDSLIIGLNGKLSLENVHDFLATLRPEPAAHLILDMSGLSFLDSAGVGALVTLFVSRRKQGKTLALAALTVQGTAVMQVAGLLKLLPVCPPVEQALAQRA